MGLKVMLTQRASVCPMRATLCRPEDCPSWHPTSPHVPLHHPSASLRPSFTWFFHLEPHPQPNSTKHPRPAASSSSLQAFLGAQWPPVFTMIQDS